MSRRELYDATRVWWKVSPRSVDRRGVTHAVAVHQGITRSVYRIDRWFSNKDVTRWGFEGEEVTTGDLFEEYVGALGKRVEFPAGSQIPVVYWPRVGRDATGGNRHRQPSELGLLGGSSPLTLNREP